MIKLIFKKLFWKVFNIKKTFLNRYRLIKQYGFISNEEIFSKIYNEKIWNKSSDLDFNSGPGSHDANIVEPYLKNIIAFLKRNKNMTIVDLGCGDFNIGSKLVEYSKRYIAIDVVEDLINRNKKIYKSKKLTFQKIDAVYEDIPHGECIFIKEVFQHISNKEIKIILKKLIKFKFLIMTESEPLFKFKPNKDKLRGPHCRTDLKSGIIIDKYPFNYRFIMKKELMRIKRDDRYIVTTLYQKN